MKQLRYILCIVQFLISGAVDSYCQEKINVITRRIEQEFEIKKGDRLIIDTERGIIQLRGWENTTLKVEMRIIAKNQDIEQGREEVKYMQYLMDQRKNEVSLKNFLLLPRNKSVSDISSILRIEYSIWLPEGMSLDIQNKFGTVTIRNTQAELKTYLEYCDLSIYNSEIDADIVINTGDLVCMNSELNAKIETRYSQVNFNSVKGNIHLTMDYGNINVTLNSDLDLDLSASRTDILLINKNCGEYTIDITGEYTPLRIDQNCYFKKENFLNNNYNSDIENRLWMLNYSPPDIKPKYIIKAEFGTINLN